MKKEVYNFKTLFFPRLRGRPIREIIALLMINPIVWMLEGSVWFIFGALGVSNAKASAPHLAIWILLAAAIAVTVFPIIYLIFIWLIDLYEREPLRFIFSLFMWGIASTLGSLICNELFGSILTAILGTVLGQAGLVLGSVGTSVMIAPIVEECMKGFGLILIAGHHEMDDTMDGIVYGFAVGVGFAAVENFIYFSFAYQEGNTTALTFISFVLYRSIICMIGHGCFTATTGMVMGFMKGRGKLSKYSQLFGILGLLGAMTLHGTFNLMAVLQGAVQQVAFRGVDYPVPMFHGPMIFLMGGIYFIIIIFALIESRARVIREKAFEEERQRQKRIASDKVIPESEVPKVTVKFCHLCGAELTQNTAFCGKCGTKAV